jgi:hypothetical protein
MVSILFDLLTSQKNHPNKELKKNSSKLGAKDIKKAELCPDFKNV